MKVWHRDVTETRPEKERKSGDVVVVVVALKNSKIREKEKSE